MPSLAFLRRLRGSVRTSAFERQMADELQFHLDRETEALIARGMDPAAAAAEARRRFGSVALASDSCRDSWGHRSIDELSQDARYAWRMLARTPGYTAVVLLTLALGIGANTAIFSVVHAVLLRSLPYTNGEALLELRQPAAGVESIGFAAVEIDEYRRQTRSLDAVVEYHQMGFNLLGATSVSRVATGVVSANFFDVIGLRPMLGRTFRADDDRDGAPAVLVLSYAYWRDALDRDPNVVGRQFEMNDRVHTVVGVLPPVTAFPEPSDVYMPVSSCPFRSAPHMATVRGMRMVSAFGRMAPGATIESVRHDLAAAAHRMTVEHPGDYGPTPGFTATAVPVREQLAARARPTLLILLATTGFVLLVVCANVANLTLARIAGRERELALRVAMGAARGRLARQLVTENLVLAIGGGGLGVAIAALTRGLLVTFTSRFTPRADEIAIDGIVLLFALALSVLTGFLAGAIPAWRARDARRRSSMRAALITAQVAIAFVLLVTAGLMVRSFIKLQAVDGGFKPDHVLTAHVDLDWVKYATLASRRTFFASFLDRLGAEPGVTHASWSLTYPLSTSAPGKTDFLIDGDGKLADRRPHSLADFRLVSSDYFQTIGMTLVGGRAFAAADDGAAPPVAIVNASLARHQLSAADPSRAIGRRVSLDDGRSWATIVGVVNDVKQYGLDTAASDELYIPFAQRGPLSAMLLVRTTDDPTRMLQTVQRIARQVDPQQPVSQPQTLEQARTGWLESPRVTMLLVSLFAGVALVVTAAGIAGVVSFAVHQRTVEIGVRMALGATYGSIVRLIVGQGMRPVTLGLACGLAGAAIVAPGVSRLLYAVGPTDLPAYGAGALTLAVVATLACLAPARRAAAVDPMRALRCE